MDTTTINYIEIGSGFYILVFLAIVIAILLAILIIRIPIVIAKNRGITGSDLTTIAILSWCGIFLGITWVIALVFSLLWGREDQIVGKRTGIDDNIDRLEKLHKLKQRGAISRQEFDAEKKKMLGNI